LGKLPERWWRRWEARGNWFDENGGKNVKESLQQYYSNNTRNWSQRFPGDIRSPRLSKKFETFSAEEENAFHDMMKSMLVLEPSKRATIEEVVMCEWMQRWGLPEVRRMQDAGREAELFEGR
jgi:serine/threonine-protein kinase SRPK3